MRIRFWDRVVAALGGLLLLLLGAGVFAFGVGVLPFQVVAETLRGPFALWQRLVIAAAGVLLCLVGVHGLSLLFRSKKEKGFILQHTENGDLSISMHAMESMVKKCLDTHDELKATHTSIRHMRDGIAVEMRISLANGVNIPITVNALQKQIKHYITSCSGVDVKEVRVLVETSNSSASVPDLQSPDMMVAEAAVAAQSPVETGQPEKSKEPIHRRLFRHEEQPMVVPVPPQEPIEGCGVVTEEPLPAEDEPAAPVDEPVVENEETEPEERTEESAHEAQTTAPEEDEQAQEKEER